MLEQNLFYMNPYTGSVASGLDWMKDYETRPEEQKTQSWEEWGGNDLILVIKDENGSWVQV